MNLVLLGPLKHIGIATSQLLLASWLNAGWLVYKLNKSNFLGLIAACERIPRFMMGCLAMGLFLDLGARHFHHQLHGFELKRILVLSALIIAGLILYFITVHILKGINFRELKQDFKSEALAESAAN